MVRGCDSRHQSHVRDFGFCRIPWLFAGRTTPKNGQHLAICWERLRDCPNNGRDCTEALRSRVLWEGRQRLSFEFHEFMNRRTFRLQEPGGVWARLFLYCAGAFGIIEKEYAIWQRRYVNTRFYRLSFSSCVFVRSWWLTVAEVFFQIRFYIF